ncbi:hypothetical protein Ocin01_18164 [Orchesella cincta]|uniref:Uncharacterized protein n=1 Tax=Orchesella cincta TaxID=48709 RepID=A0A1D2M6C0_ORCCI|nr:hypothetical protein Ocin01_18164 [Orchesella cincta]
MVQVLEISSFNLGLCAKFQVSWPPRSGSNIRSLVQKSSCSKTRVDEVRFSRILGQYDDFSKACQKLTKSLNTSTLESESDSINRIRPRSQKRKPVATSQSSSSNNLDSESSGDNETSHPKISGTWNLRNFYVIATGVFGKVKLLILSGSDLEIHVFSAASTLRFPTVSVYVDSSVLADGDVGPFPADFVFLPKEFSC